MAAHTESPTISGPGRWDPTSNLVSRLADARKSGIATIVNLLPPSAAAAREKALAASLGIRYLSLPVWGDGDLSFEMARALRKVLDEPSFLPVLVHCNTGERVGALMAMDAFARQRVTSKEALDIGRRYGLKHFAHGVLAKMMRHRQ